MSFQGAVHSAISSVGRFAAFKEAKNTLLAKQEEAKKKVTEVKEAKKTQRRNFMEYLRKQETSLGGTVGDLPPAMQKQIASGYTKSQRQALMNKMDKEATDGSKQRKTT